MELNDYLRAMGKRLLVLVLLPILAGAAAFGILYKRPAQFQSTTTVRLPVPADAPTSVISQANSDFTEALTSDAVTVATSKATGVPTSTIAAGLSVKQSGSSRILEVTYVTERPETADKVASAATRTALENLFSPDAALKQKQLEAAQKEYDAARAALDAFSAASATLPADLYTQKAGEINQLEIQLVQNQATDGTTDAFGHRIDNTQAIKTFQAAIAQRRVELNRLTALVSQVRPIEDRLQTAIGSLGIAQRDLQDAQAEMDGIASPTTIVTAPVTKANKAKALVKTVGMVGAVAIVLAVALLVLLELVRPSSRRRVGPALAPAPVADQSEVVLTDRVRSAWPGAGPREALRHHQ